jgi:hypothetical protein
MLHVRYEVAGTTSRLPALSAAALFKEMGFVGEEYVGRPRGSPATTPCTLTLVVSEDALGFVKAAAGGNLAFADAPFSPRLRDAVRLWLNAKADLAGETRVPGSETVAVVHLSIYRAEAFVTYASHVAASLPLPAKAAPEAAKLPAASVLSEEAAEVLPMAASEAAAGGESLASSADAPRLPQQQLQQALAPPADCAFALAGDAAFGVPYFRSLNNGLLCGSELAAALSEHGSASGNAWRCGGGGSPPLESYARFVERLAGQELAGARLRAKALALASSGASAAHALPAGASAFDAARVERWRRWDVPALNA